VPTSFQFGVGSGAVNGSGVADPFATDGVCLVFGCAEPTYVLVVLIPTSSAILDFSQPANSQYVPLMIP